MKTVIDKFVERIGIQHDAVVMVENTIRMVASSCGVMLRNGAVILPGAFGPSVLRKSVVDGWVDISHEWDGEPIGFFNDVSMNGDDLMIDAQFHTHDEAQKQRTIISERLAAGKSVAVSIGYSIDYQKTHWFEDGMKLWEWCESEKHDMSRFDPSIKKYKNSCWVIPTVNELHEVSICNIGANPAAKVLQVNNHNENNLGECVTLADGLNSVLATVTRAKQVHQMRQTEQRTFGKDRMDQITSIRDACNEIIDAHNATTTPMPDHAEIVRRKFKLAQTIVQIQNV